VTGPADPSQRDDDLVPRRTARPGDAPPSTAPADTRRNVGGRDLPIAIVSGVLLGGLFLGSLFWHPLAFTVVIAGFVAVAGIEAAMELRRIGYPVAVPALLLGGLVTVFGAYRSMHTGQAVGILVLFLGSVAWELADPHRRDVVRTIATTLLLGLWTAFLGSYGVLLVNRHEDGAIAVLAVIGAAVFGDVGAYAVGVRFGRHKIAPAISPNKTVEGLIGGVVTAAVLAAIVLPLVGDLFTVGSAVVIAVVSVLAGFVGDLTESMVKRDLGLKDLGRILPGHGGVLDRVDGILFAMPVGFYALALMT
jgi:phosphatidate cytidylyltransferase